MTLGARYSLELSEWIQTKHRNPEETEEGMASDSSKEASSSGVLTKFTRIELRPCSKLQLLGPKKD